MNEKTTIAETINEYIKNPIETNILPLADVQQYIKSLLVKLYELSDAVAEKIVEKDLHQYLSQLDPGICVLIESPYVDKMYRDTYYNYYSSKLKPYFRDCIRLSFFTPPISLDKFKRFDDSDKEEVPNTIKEHYLGFLVLRPTFPRIIGRNAISPKAKKINNINCCLTKVNASVNSIKQKVSAFPHASQDGESMTCAETTVWSILEYFGNKYPEYKPVLLSTINKTLDKFSYKRLLPSTGLTAEQITFALREFGFGALIYSRQKLSPKEFKLNYIISIYIESGIPIIGVVKNKELGHAVNIIGRENYDPATIVNTEPHKWLNDLPIIDFNNILRKYVFIDDNHPPYQIAKLDKPCEDYYSEAKWHSCEITNVIVPLHHKIYLDAEIAGKNFYNALKHSVIGIADKEKRILRSFLASTRSYKQYIALNHSINPLVKELILAIPMPKFIWIAEVSKSASFLEGKCDELYIQDATEPVSDPRISVLSSLSLLACYTNGTFFVQSFGKFEGVATFATTFESYKENLN